MFDHAVDAGVFQLAASGTRWLSTAWNGGFRIADAAYNVSVPSDWQRAALAEYVGKRRERAGFERPGPALLTGVDLDHARGARLGPAVAFATVGLTNPAALPMEVRAVPGGLSGRPAVEEVGTINLLVGTTRPLTDGALGTLLATAVEAKTATVRALSGFTGTTTDAVIVGSPTSRGRGEEDRQQWAGSGTELGNAARVCVRDAVRASVRSRHDDESVPEDVAAAEYGVVAGGAPEVFAP